MKNQRQEVMFRFKWNHGGESEITMVFKNLLEE